MLLHDRNSSAGLQYSCQPSLLRVIKRHQISSCTTPRSYRGTAALRRIGSIADTLKVNGLSEKLAPLLPPKGDIDLAPSEGEDSVWRDARWQVRWPQTPEQFESVAYQ